MAILLLNAGSSSLKTAVMEPGTARVLATALADWAGEQGHYTYDGKTLEIGLRGHAVAVEQFLQDLPPTLRTKLKAVGHRIVHGGAFADSIVITPEIRSRIDELAELAPLHNPAALATLDAAQKHLPRIPHIAVFDTAFHATLPPEAYTYPLPDRWIREWGIRKYGFHGLSHAYCSGKAVEILGRYPSRRLIICHLGHGCSASAILDGVCMDTTMGFTPLDGLMMGTRSGAIDPGILLHVESRKGISSAEADRALNHEAGLLGVSGYSGDMREVLDAAGKGHERARLAIGVYCHRVRQAIGALAATIGGVDSLVFTAGVGEHAAVIRESVCKGLDFLGLVLDSRRNQQARGDCDIASEKSRGRILVIATREDLTMLREVERLLGRGNPS